MFGSSSIWYTPKKNWKKYLLYKIQTKMNTTINNANTKYHNIIINDINEVQTIVFDNSSSINENEYIILQNKLKNIFEYLQSSKMIIDSQYEAMEKQHNSLLGVKVVLQELYGAMLGSSSIWYTKKKIEKNIY